jgi:hypothetical protein
MSKAILIMGESGSGKTTSMRNLEPASTFYIDADGKGLQWRGWRDQYSKERKNFFKTSDVATIEKCFVRISKEHPQVKLIIVDTLNACMIDDEMVRMKEKGFDKWIDAAVSVYALINLSHSLRNDLTVIFTAHTQTDYDDSGYKFTHVKTSGRKIAKIVLESKFSTVLLAKANLGAYVFETQANNSTAKTPLGAFEVKEIENDMAKVLAVLSEF